MSVKHRVARGVAEQRRSCVDAGRTDTDGGVARPVSGRRVLNTVKSNRPSTPYDSLLLAGPPSPITNAPEAGSVFQEIGGLGGAFGGCSHLGGDLTGSSGALRSEDGPQIRHQRFLGGVGEAPSKADFQFADRSCPQRLIDRDRKDQRRGSGPDARERGAGPPVVDDSAADGKDGRVVYRAHNLNVVEFAGRR